MPYPAAQSSSHSASRSAQRFPPALPGAGAQRGPLTSHCHGPGRFTLLSPPARARTGSMAASHPALSGLLPCPWLPAARHLCVPLSAVGNCGLASWEGGTGAWALCGERPCPLQTELGPEMLLLPPSQAPLSACHQNSIPSASPAMSGHSSLPPVLEQLVVAAYVSVCRVREGGGEQGPSQQFLFLNLLFRFVLFLK